MTTSIQSTVDAYTGNDVAVVEPPFYVVSLKKMATLFIATLGMYGVYWFYKNWSNYKNYASDTYIVDRSIWPAPRGVFAIFFVHALFREIKLYGRDKAEVVEWENKSQATKLVVTMIIAQALDRMSFRGYGTPFSDVASLLILVPLVTQYLNVQHMINIACGDPAGKMNSELTKANYAWIGFGIIMWIMIVIGFFLPD